MSDAVFGIVPLFDLLEAAIVFFAVVRGGPLFERDIRVVCVMARNAGFGKGVANLCGRCQATVGSAWTLPVGLLFSEIWEGSMRVGTGGSLRDCAAEGVYLEDDAGGPQDLFEDAGQRGPETVHPAIVSGTGVLEKDRSFIGVIPREGTGERCGASGGVSGGHAGELEAAGNEFLCIARANGGEEDGDLAAVHHPGGEAVVREFAGGVEPRLEEPGGAAFIELVGAEFPGGEGRWGRPGSERHLRDNAEISIAASLAGPEEVGLIAGVARLAVSIDHSDGKKMITGKAPFPCEHAITAAECEAGEAHGFTRAGRQKSALAEKVLVYIGQEATRPGGEHSGRGIEVKPKAA